jgi:hypothetical protein
MSFVSALKTELCEYFAGKLTSDEEHFQGIFSLDLCEQDPSLRLCLFDSSSLSSTPCSIWKVSLNDGDMLKHV